MKIFTSKNEKAQNFHKICALDFSKMLCDENHSKGSKSDCFLLFGAVLIMPK